MTKRKRIRVGTRKSALARTQTGHAMARMEDVGLAPGEVLVTSHGDVDRVSPLHSTGASGVFTRALEDALAAGEIDAAVHSLKDLPLRPRFPVVAVLPRADPRDVLLVRVDKHEPTAGALQLAPGARVGTSAPRRHTQLLAHDPECVLTDVRGNVDTRIRFLEKGGVDALLVAAAALDRLQPEIPGDVVRVPLPTDAFPTCPGQGALAVQAPADGPFTDTLRELDDADTRIAVTGERVLLRHLGGGCGLPFGSTLARTTEGWELSATLAEAGWGERDGAPRLRRIRLRGIAPRVLVQDAARALLAPWTAPAVERPPPAVEETMVLAGDRILLVMDPTTAGPYARALGEAGAEAVAWPTTLHEDRDLTDVPADVAKTYGETDWVIVASPRGVSGAARLAELPRNGNAPPRHAAVGAGTARALRRAGLPCHLVSPDGTGAGLARLLADVSEPGVVVAPGAAEPRPELREGLRDRGFTVAEWPVYDTRPLRPLPPPALTPPVDAVVIASPSAARALAAGADGDLFALTDRFVSFGPTTAEAMRDAGLPVHAVVRRRSPSGLREALRP